MLISIQQALDLLRQGKVIAVPTDTVYGLAVDPCNLCAIEALFALKQRPLSSAFPLLASTLSDIKKWLLSPPASFYDLAKRCWPGPLTCVMPVHSSILPLHIPAPQSTLAFRIPNNATLLSLLSSFGPLAVTSANYSGQPPLDTIPAIEQAFGPAFPCLEHPVSPIYQLNSTIIAYCNTTWSLVRKGALSLETIEQILHPLSLQPSAL